MDTPCHFISVRGLDHKVFIPGCMNGAVHGIHACICDRKKHKKRIEEEIQLLKDKTQLLEDRISELEEGIFHLTQLCQMQHEIIAKTIHIDLN